MQTKLYDQLREENAAHLRSVIQRKRDELIDLHDSLRVEARDNGEELRSASGFMRLAVTEIMSAIDSLNVAERFLV